MFISDVIMSNSLVFLLFEEPRGGVSIPKNSVECDDSADSRKGWKAMEFAKKHNLTLVGVNFFLTEAD